LGDVGYRYDAIGRLSTIVYPGGDAVAWNTQHIVYELMPAADRNIGGVHWRRTATLGNKIDQLYYDAMLMPIIHDVHRDDNGIYFSSWRIRKPRHHFVRI
jgi:hypothetical protein